MLSKSLKHKRRANMIAREWLYRQIRWFFTVGLVSCCFSIQAEIKEVKPAGPHCSKATGLSKGLAESIAERKKVSVGSLSLLRSSPDPSIGCIIKVDTPRGPVECMLVELYSDGKDFWVGGFCI
jgi:hypothetical protein